MVVNNSEDLYALKDRANKAFEEKRYLDAVTDYSIVIDSESAPLSLLSVCYANRSYAHLLLENWNEAKNDSLACLRSKPSLQLSQKAYHRLGSAYFNLQQFSNAEAIFVKLVNLRPHDPRVQQSLLEAKEAAKAALNAKMLAAISLSDDIEQPAPIITGLPLDYNGFRIPDNLTLQTALIEVEKLRHIRPHITVIRDLLERVSVLLRKEPNVVRLNLEEGEKCTVIGDIHGQIFDLLYILSSNPPSASRPMVFLGDYVDRGSYSVEVFAAVLLLKLAAPSKIVLLRGNHETLNLTAIYGCKAEVTDKLHESMYKDFIKTFQLLPLCCIINDSAFAVHGGIPPNSDFMVSHIEQLDRFREPRNEAETKENDVMSALLWADPCPTFGTQPSKRGSGVSFGPDITERFLRDNNLDIILRGHEVQNTCVLTHNNRLATVFSAPNYVNMGNTAAVAFYDWQNNLTYQDFNSAPTPENALKPLHYCAPFSFFV
ncbi:hypothetical protein RCL1_004385 [Eukaryota sp. TZLM3-RCL]